MFRKSVYPSDRISLVWDLGQGRTTAVLVAAVLTVLLVAAACSGEGSGSTKKTTDAQESTPVSTTGQETTGSTPPPEATLGEGPGPPSVVLRLEGDPKTTFSGICNVRGEENVLSGRVPKRYAFNPQGQKLSCRIQKQDAGRGSLKVILSAGGTTRSVQQTNVRGGVINISYAGG
jgi:hypothetical protein